jgi:hypothetical protein
MDVQPVPKFKTAQPCASSHSSFIYMRQLSNGINKGKIYSLFYWKWYIQNWEAFLDLDVTWWNEWKIKMFSTDSSISEEFFEEIIMVVAWLNNFLIQHLSIICCYALFFFSTSAKILMLHRVAYFTSLQKMFLQSTESQCNILLM